MVQQNRSVKSKRCGKAGRLKLLTIFIVELNILTECGIILKGLYLLNLEFKGFAIFFFFENLREKQIAIQITHRTLRDKKNVINN